MLLKENNINHFEHVCIRYTLYFKIPTFSLPIRYILYFKIPNFTLPIRHILYFKIPNFTLPMRDILNFYKLYLPIKKFYLFLEHHLLAVYPHLNNYDIYHYIICITLNCTDKKKILNKPSS